MKTSATISLGGITLEVTGDYQPAEPPDYRVRGYSLGYPGCPASFEVHSVTLPDGTDLSDLLEELGGTERIAEAALEAYLHPTRARRVA